ncbi:angiopoietin-related protein 7-like isoform X2 [Drosophila sulfurigaster albostrigata]|nr:angiopoietin-related protein 7-like isoform X2 [Drosophila sulfurigaster albostrigata]
MGRKIIKSVLLLILHEILFVATAAAEKPCQLSNILSGSNIDGILQPILDCLHSGNDLELSKMHEDHIKELNVNNFMEYQEIEKIHEKVMEKAIELDEYRNKILKGGNDLQVCQIEVDKLESEINVQKTTIDRLKTNSKLFGEYDKCKDELIHKRNKLEYVKLKVGILNATLMNALTRKPNLQMQKITENHKTIQLELDDYQNKLRLKENDIRLCQENIGKLNMTTQKRQHTRIPTSCISFGDHPGVHQIEVLYYDVFDVLCDSHIAGPGWIVIQQRVGGNESFNRDWTTYGKGFGSFESDFFLGLEKIHRLTSSQDYELYVHLVFLNGTIKYAQYDNFKISNEDNSYALSSLGKFKGNVVDEMKNYVNSKFSTFDQDNDTEDVHNCAEHFKSGWWFTHCYY